MPCYVPDRLPGWSLVTYRSAALLVLLWPSVSSAADVQLEGYYRARFRLYDSLSLNPAVPNAEGTAAGVEHRLWLRPHIIAGDNVSVYADVFGLDGLDWGQSTDTMTDPVTGDTVPIELTDSLIPGVYDTTGSNDSRGTLSNLSLSRAWAEVKTPIGKISFGRMPLHWGLGVWQNDGLSWNGDRGDSADRLQWDGIYDKVFTEASVETDAEGLINGNDDTSSATGAVGYRSELVTTGLQVQYRVTPSRQFNLVTLDGAFSGEIGTLDLGAEVIGQFGSGNLANGVNNVSIASFGGVVDAELHTSAVNLGAEVGLASGDDNVNDAKIKTFTFDRDYEVGLVMFEQPMPVLKSTVGSGDGRNYDTTLSGYGVSNAIYFRPSASRTIVEGLDAHASLLMARTFAAPDTAGLRKGYGNEIDVGAKWSPNEHFTLDGTGALFLPGTFYSAYTSDVYSGFNHNVWGLQVVGQVKF